MRPINVLLSGLSAITLAGVAAHAEGDIAFIRNERLFVLPTDAAGLPRSGSHPIEVCRTWHLTGDDTVSINWVDDHHIALSHHVDAWNGPKRFGLSNKSPIGRIWIVPAHANARMTRVVEGERPSFSSDGRFAAFVRDISDGPSHYHVEAYTFDIKRRRLVDLGEANDSPAWVPGRHQVVVVRQGKPSPKLVICNAETGTTLKDLGNTGNTIDIIVSPDRKWLASHNHLSRPLTGHFVRGLGRESAELPESDQYAPPILYEWAPDSRAILVDWRVPDPNNDGNWLADRVVFSRWPSGRSVILANGRDATFSPDGRAVLFRTGRGRVGDVRRILTTGRLATTLIRHVDAFTVRHHGASLEGTAFGPGQSI